MTIKELKQGEFFTKKPIEEPKDNQVWVRGEYIRSEKRYECYNWADINRFCYIKGDKEVYTGFTF